jgi:hypothetical protein
MRRVLSDFQNAMKGYKKKTYARRRQTFIMYDRLYPGNALIEKTLFYLFRTGKVPIIDEMRSLFSSIPRSDLRRFYHKIFMDYFHE